MAAGRIHNFAFFLLTFYFPKPMSHLTNHPLNCSTAQLSAFAPLHLSRVLYKSTLFLQNKPNLLNAQMNVTSFYTVDYENKRLADAAKTNPIQSQYKPNTKPIAEKPKMKLNSYSTKDYENETAFRPQKNKPNSNPIKPNL